MRHTRMLAFVGAAALGCTTVATATTATGAPAVTSAAATSSAADVTTVDGSFVVLADKGVSAKALAKTLQAKGATITSVNERIGMITLASSDAGFAKKARGMKGVHSAAAEGVVGRAPGTPKQSKTERPRLENPGKSHGKSAHSKKGKKGAMDPLDPLLWGMDMIDAPEAHRLETGDKRVKVGVMDTGVDATHPDIAPNFDHKLSRNLVTDMPDIDGECEVEGCVDPATVDEGGHGTHVAGTIAAAKNGMGVSGVAPTASIVNVRSGQDSGYFFVGPTVNALTYSADAGLDVVNMSFYVDPWAYNCIDGAPEDGDEAAQEQNMIIEAMTRALTYAHDKDVTLVGALGNAATDLANPGMDDSSPDYPEGAAYPRTIDNATCFDLPVEGPHVIGVSAVGPTERKSYFSNYTTDLTSDEIEVSAPGGDYRDNFGTDQWMKPSNLILSTIPKNVALAEGSIDEDGNVTPDAEGWVLKDCQDVPGKGEQCGYYEYYQGTSMASPHAAGVAALIVSAHGKVEGRRGFTLDADRTRQILMDSARDKACPEPRLFTYPGIPAAYDAECVGDADFNGFYGDGIVNAYNGVTYGG